MFIRKYINYGQLYTGITNFVTLNLFQGLTNGKFQQIKQRFFTKYLIIFFFFVFSLNFAQAEVIEMKAENNAYRHNNLGLMYLNEKYYYGAIKEFQIAIDLMPNSQATATFYLNLGKAYEAIGYYKLAQPCFEKALSINVLCFDYYLKTAENYKKLGILNEKLIEFQTKPYSPLNDIMVGLIYIQKGHVTTGITILDDFCNKEQNLLITTGVKEYIKSITDK